MSEWNPLFYIINICPWQCFNKLIKSHLNMLTHQTSVLNNSSVLPRIAGASESIVSYKSIKYRAAKWNYLVLG